MTDAFICDALRTPFGRYGGALSAVRADDLGAIPIRALLARHPELDPAAIDDVLYGCANQAGEDNRNVARMSALLAGLPVDVPGVTLNRLCGSGLNAVGSAAQAIRAGEAGLLLAGGVESMSRAPFVMPKATSAFARENAIYDTTIGWRFVNPLMKAQYGVDSMPETAENVADDFGVNRADQDAMALRSQLRAVAAQKRGFFDAEITPVTRAAEEGRRDRRRQGRAPARDLARGARPSSSPSCARTARSPPATPPASTTAPARCCWPAPRAAKTHGLTPRARVLGMAVAGVAPRIMGIGPAPASQEAAGAPGPDDRADGRHRAERGLRRAGPGGAAPAGRGRRRPARQSERRRDRARPSAGRQRRAAGDDGRQPAARAPAAATRCARCASASARASRWWSSASEVAQRRRLPELDAVAFRVGDPAELAVLGDLGLVVDGAAFALEHARAARRGRRRGSSP